MSREDKKKSEPTLEEKFFSGITGDKLKDWKKGREFIVTDDRLLLVMERRQPLTLTDSMTIKGHSLYFDSCQPKMDAAGNMNCTLVFTDGVSTYQYDTGKTIEEALESTVSTDLPMLIDMNMVITARNKLKGQKLWTLTNLWYNDKEEKIPGKKYVEVEVEDIFPGNMIFPLWLQLQTTSGEKFYVYMNLGNGGTDSRSFHNLFSLSNLKKHYPEISEDFWELICDGKVAIGMSKQECRLSLGAPVETSSGHDYSQTLDIWNYNDGKVLWFEDGKLVRFKG